MSGSRDGEVLRTLASLTNEAWVRVASHADVLRAEVSSRVGQERVTNP